MFWRDVLEKFRSAQTIKSAGATLPFVKDGPKLIIPLRIAHHPGVVLQVVDGSKPQADTPKAVNPTNDSSAKEPNVDNSNLNIQPPSETTQNQSLTRETAAQIAATIKSDLSRSSRGLPEKAKSSLRAYSQLYGDLLEAIASGEETQAIRIKQSIDVHYGRLQVEMSKNKVLQRQLVKSQQKIQQLQQQSKDELLGEQKPMDQMQQQALDKLATIQSKLQAILNQTYELYEDPIPRLFIVLPKASGPDYSSARLAPERFRLYFLCECGAHTMSDDCITLPEVHLAMHEGYDLENSTDFFNKYGAYLLAMMYMVKYATATPGLAVPSLANFEIPDSLAQDHRHIEHVRKNIVPLVDDTISYLQNINQTTGATSESTTDHGAPDKFEALKGPDLRRLEPYLKIRDQGRVLGNLYRMVKPDGHVRWICAQHHRTAYPEWCSQQLRDIVKANNGKFVEETGMVDIKVANGVVAKQFYDILAKTSGVQELDITLEWDATMDELRSLAKTVTRTSVVRITVDGTHLKGSAPDIYNRTRRFDPIVQLVSKTRIQSLRLRGFDDFFSKVNNPTLVPTPKFRMFSIDSSVTSQEKAVESFVGFLGYCSSLTAVELKLHSQYPLTKAMDDILGKLPRLESLKIDRGNIYLAASISERRVHDMAMTIKRLRGLVIDDLKFMQQGDITRLAIECTPQKANDDQLIDILRYNARLVHLRIGCQEARCLAVINLVLTTRSNLLQGGAKLCQLQILELMEEKLTPFDERGLFDDKTHILTRLSFTEGSPEFDMRTWIRVQNRRLITVQDPLYDFVQEYGWSIVNLRVPWTFSDPLAAVLDDVTSRKGSKLKRFALSPFMLTDAGLNHLDSVIERSEDFRLLLNDLDQSDHAETTRLLLGRFGKRLSGISLAGGSPEQWLPQIASSFPARSYFPKLTSISLGHYTRTDFPPSCVSWLASMISAPSCELTSSMEIVEESSCAAESGSGESLVAQRDMTVMELVGFNLQSDEWRVMIEAIDFSTPPSLSFLNSNFDMEQLQLLVERVPDNMDLVPLKTLNLRNTDITKKDDILEMESMLSVLRKKAPLVKIMT